MNRVSKYILASVFIISLCCSLVFLPTGIGSQADLEEEIEDEIAEELSSSAEEEENAGNINNNDNNNDKIMKIENSKGNNDSDKNFNSKNNTL